MFSWRDKNNRKRGREWPVFEKSLIDAVVMEYNSIKGSEFIVISPVCQNND